ncbi:MAG: oxidoreductase, partial [Sulfuricella sp.]|nr:oxidoreductase [Sulfuricella sp.]
DALAATGTGRVVRRFPVIGGIDVAGTVVTSGDTRFREGEAVLVTGYGMGVEHDGGYAEYSRVPADWVVPLPQGMSTADAMAIGTAGFTAALAIMRMEQNGLKPANGPVVVTGASGGVGSVAVDLLAGLGYEVTAISGKDDQHDYLRHLGASQVLSRHTLEMGRKPLEKTIWAGAVDPVGGETLAWLTRTMKQDGTIASCGLTAGVELHTTVMPFILRGVSLLGIDSVQCPMELRRRVWERLASDMRPLHLKEMTRTIRFEQLPETFDALLKGTVKGRVVVEI